MPSLALLLEPCCQRHSITQCFNPCPDVVAPSEWEGRGHNRLQWPVLRGTEDWGKSIHPWKDLLTTSFPDKFTLSFLCFSEVWKVGVCLHQSSNSGCKRQRTEVRITKLRNMVPIRTHPTSTTIFWASAMFQILLDTEDTQWMKEIRRLSSCHLQSRRGSWHHSFHASCVCVSGASRGWGTLLDAGETKLN